MTLKYIMSTDFAFLYFILLITKNKFTFGSKKVKAQNIKRSEY